LAIRFVNGSDRVYAMPAKIMRSVLKVILGIVQRTERVFDLRVSPCRRGWRRQRHHQRKQTE
jgi:hypothetical protein